MGTAPMQGNDGPGIQLPPHGYFRSGVLLAMVRHHWFVRLRWMIASAAAALLLIEHLQVPDLQRPYAVALCIVTLAVVNVIWTVVSRNLCTRISGDEATSSTLLRRVTLFVNAQMTVDLLLLTVVLRYSGGIESPMAVFYLFHILVAALLLKPLNALVQSLCALLLSCGLAIGECVGLIQPHYPFLASTTTCDLHTHWLYVLSCIGVWGAGALGIFHLTRQVFRPLADRERKLRAADGDLRQSQLAVRESLARRSRFMQTAAHQLKSPLAGIETLAGLIHDGAVAPEAVDGIVMRIRDRCQQAIRQVTELLTLVHVQEAEPTRHRFANTDASQTVRKVTVWFAEMARSKNINMQVETTGCGGAYAAVDAHDLENCISNLIDNAIKYTPEGGSVRVDTKCYTRTVSISVKDTGMGFAEGSEDDLFDPFRRGNLALANGIPGSGLGLAIVREVVEQASGRIDVRSAVGKGSEFVLTFPRRDAPPSTAAVGNTGTAASGNGDSSAG